MQNCFRPSPSPDCTLSENSNSVLAHAGGHLGRGDLGGPSCSVKTPRQKMSLARVLDRVVSSSCVVLSCNDDIKAVCLGRGPPGLADKFVR